MKVKAITLVLMILLPSIGLNPFPTASANLVENSLWSFGVPRTLDWSDYGLAVGTSAGYTLVYDSYGKLMWCQKVNYTSVWSFSWSRNGELVVATLGPPGAIYVFNKNGLLLWSREFDDSQVYSVLWDGDMLVVGGPGFLVFDRNGNLVWSKSGTTLAVSLYGEMIAAISYFGEWGVYVFDRHGRLLWNFSGNFNYISWSDNGSLAAAGKYDGVVYVFDRLGRLKWIRGVGGEIGSLVWFGEHLAIGCLNGVIVFDGSGNIVWKYDTGGYFVEALSAYNERLLVGSQSGNLTMVDLSGKPIWSYWTCGYILAISYHNSLIASASSDGYIQVLDVEGNLRWKNKIGFRVDAVSLSSEGLIAAGGWDLNLTVMDLNGNLKWSAETGWVKHLAWHENLLAVGGYDSLFVFDKDGHMKWRFETGKIRSLSWSKDGLLAVGCSDRFGVFSCDGSILWGYMTPDWVLSVSWSNDLLAVAIAGTGVFVFDKGGHLRWSFKSVMGENATIPWAIAASWWNNLLLVASDYLYMLDETGELVWVNHHVRGSIIVPGRNFVAVGGGGGVYVLDVDGELEWSYTSPESVRPKDYFTKLYPETVRALSWSGTHLIVGDSLGRIFLFNVTGDLIWVYNAGDAVLSIAGDGRIFVAGGGGGLIIGKTPIISKSVKKILLELPIPYNMFERALINKTLIYMNGSIILSPSHYLYSPSFNVSEGAAYAFLEVELTSTSPTKFIVIPREEFEGFINKTDGVSKLSWTGEKISVKVRLSPGTYILAISSDSKSQVNYFIHAYESFLPSFEEKRVYLPVGLADYGVAELSEGRIGYKYNYTEALGIIRIKELYATRTFDGGETRHWVTLQLNVFLHVHAEGGDQTYWIQNLVNINTEDKRLRKANNLWNLTTQSPSILVDLAVEGNGCIMKEKRLGNYYYYATDWIEYNYPLDIILFLSTNVEGGVVKIYFGQSFAGGPIEKFDTLSLKVNATSAYFKVDPSAAPLPNNIELVFTGPAGGVPKTVVEKIDASLKLLVNLNGKFIHAPTAYSYGYITSERVTNVTAEYDGDFGVILKVGRTSTSQLYYSTSILPSIRILYINDPLHVFNGIHLVREEEVRVPFGYSLNLGNMTRLILVGYTPIGRDEIILNWCRQYYVAVTSEHGRVEGGGWYNEGDKAKITLSQERIENNTFVYIFQGWEQDGRIVSKESSYIFEVNAPLTLKAIWIIEQKPAVTSETTEQKPVTPIIDSELLWMHIIVVGAVIVLVFMCLILKKKRMFPKLERTR
ncbi:MAG: thermopsin family protease [Nitrososphaeria archaeon]